VAADEDLPFAKGFCDAERRDRREAEDAAAAVGTRGFLREGVENNGSKEKKNHSKKPGETSKFEALEDRIGRRKGSRPADGALILLQEPRIDALLVMHVHAGQQSHFITFRKRQQTNTVQTLASLLAKHGHIGRH
jgi:hypothetical protein